MATQGIVKTLTGNVKAISPSGTQRELRVGDVVLLNEQIITGDASSIVIEFDNGEVLDLGRNEQITLSEDVLNSAGGQTQPQPISTDDTVEENAAIKKPLPSGEDTQTVSEEFVVEGEGRHEQVIVEYINSQVTIVAGGFDTTSASQNVEQQTIEEPEDLIIDIDIDIDIDTDTDTDIDVPPAGSTNGAPVTTPVTLTAIAEDSGVRGITQLELLENASDVDGDTLTAIGLTISSGNGTLVDNVDGTWNYTPVADDDTAVSFTYDISDGTATINTGSAALDITPVNDAPVAVDDVASTNEDTVLNSTVDLDFNDTDVDLDALMVVAGTFATTQGGSITIAADGSYTYTPAANFNGTDTVDYTVTDGTLTDTGTLTITVTPVNDASVILNDTDLADNIVARHAAMGTLVGITALGTDADANDTVIHSLDDNAGGLFTIDADTGVVTLARDLTDDDRATQYDIVVRADSTDGSVATGTFTIGVQVELSLVEQGFGGFVINGVSESDASGLSVSSAGDVNGDGLADLIVGAPCGEDSVSMSSAFVQCYGNLNLTGLRAFVERPSPQLDEHSIRV